MSAEGAASTGARPCVAVDPGRHVNPVNTNLAPVFLDDQPVTLQDARPKVSAILAAVGKPDATQVKWLKSSSDTTGKTLRAEEVVDRTAQTQPIYLSSGQKGAGTGASQGAQAGGRQREGAGAEASGGNPSGGFRQDAARQGGSPQGKQPMAEESWAKPSRGEASSGEREGTMAGKAGRTSEESSDDEARSARDAPDALDKPSA